MILNGTTYYMTVDITRFLGLIIALIITIIVETLGIYYLEKRYPLKNFTSCAFIVAMVNCVTFTLGILMFVIGV